MECTYPFVAIKTITECHNIFMVQGLKNLQLAVLGDDHRKYEVERMFMSASTLNLGSCMTFLIATIDPSLSQRAL